MFQTYKKCINWIYKTRQFHFEQRIEQIELYFSCANFNIFFGRAMARPYIVAVNLGL